MKFTMNRRRFLELLSSAALGSGIVYSFPSVIVPNNIMPFSDRKIFYNNISEMPPISFSVMDKAYKKLCKGNIRPEYIHVSKNRLEELRNLTGGFLKFHGTEISYSDSAPDNVIYIEDPSERRQEVVGGILYDATGADPLFI